MYIDTHAHLTDSSFEGKISEIISEYKNAEVGLVINVGYDLKSSEESSVLALENEGIYFCAGMHPTDGEDATEDNLRKIYDLAKCKKCVGIGEIGLDYHYGGDRERQKKNFEAQLALAAEVSLPIAVHARDCAEDMLSIIKKWHDKIPAVVLHCYSLGAECAKVFNKYGCYYAFGGAITFKNNKQISSVVQVVSVDRVLSETDCPYMTPEPFRGKTNSPKYVGLVTEKLAELYRKESLEMQSVILNNAKRVFTEIDK